MSKAKIELPRCNHLDKDGYRCRRKSAIKHRVHLDSELYHSGWVEVNLCPDHFIILGGSFNKTKKKP